MDNTEIMKKLQRIMAEQLNLEGVELTEGMRFKEDLEVDSLDLFELVMSLEEEFGVEIPAEDLEKLSTVGDVVNYVKEKGEE